MSFHQKLADLQEFLAKTFKDSVKRKEDSELELISFKLLKIEQTFAEIFSNLTKLKEYLIKKLIFGNQTEAEVSLLIEELAFFSKKINESSSNEKILDRLSQLYEEFKTKANSKKADDDVQLSTFENILSKLSFDFNNFDERVRSDLWFNTAKFYVPISKNLTDMVLKNPIKIYYEDNELPEGRLCFPEERRNIPYITLLRLSSEECHLKEITVKDPETLKVISSLPIPEWFSLSRFCKKRNRLYLTSFYHLIILQKTAKGYKRIKFVRDLPIGYCLLEDTDYLVYGHKNKLTFLNYFTKAETCIEYEETINCYAYSSELRYLAILLRNLVLRIYFVEQPGEINKSI